MAVVNVAYAGARTLVNYHKHESLECYSPELAFLLAELLNELDDLTNTYNLERAYFHDVSESTKYPVKLLTMFERVKEEL